MIKRNKYNPELIDQLADTNTMVEVAVGGKAKWFIAKPYGMNTLPKRIYQAWLVLTGKATATIYIEDMRDILDGEFMCRLTQNWK